MNQEITEMLILQRLNTDALSRALSEAGGYGDIFLGESANRRTVEELLNTLARNHIALRCVYTGPKRSQ